MEKKQDLAQYGTVRAVSIKAQTNLKPTRAILPQDPSIKRFLILCHNQHYTIRVDEHTDGEIRYLCWQKPRGILQRPSLVIRNGKCTESPSLDKTEYVFEDGDLTYSLERIVSKGDHGTTHIFLEVSDRDNQKSTWKMEERPFPKYLGDFL